ncbi:hypothetical protein GCM10023162_14180 [Klenkia terrae]
MEHTVTAFGLHPRSYPVPSVDHRPLAQAATALPVSTKVLWVEYLTLGGSLDLDWFCAHLDSPGGAQPEEHAIVVETVTEFIAAEGLPLRVA